MRREAEPPEPDDEDLLRGLRAGEPAAFEALVERYQGRLLRFAASLLRDPGAAEDVVQETFARLIRNLPRAGSNGAFGPWLFQVCRNLVYDFMKTETRERQRREKAAPGEALLAPPAERLEHGELHDLVGREIDLLPAREREVLCLKVREGLSYQQIAELTGLASGTIGWLVHSALQRLATKLRAVEAW